MQHNRYSERNLGHALRRALRCAKMRAELNRDLAHSRNPAITLAQHSTSVLARIPMSVIRENARKTRLSGVTHEQRLADSAAKCAAAHEAAEASLQQRDAAAKAHQQAIEARLRKAILLETMPPTVTVPDQLALRGIIRKYKERIMLNWDCEAKRITTTATTPWSKLLKPDLVAIVRLYLSSSSPTITRIPMTCKYLIGISESLDAAIGASAVGAAAPEPSLATQPLHPPPAMPARVVEETTAARCSHVGLWAVHATGG